MSDECVNKWVYMCECRVSSVGERKRCELCICEVVVCEWLVCVSEIYMI